MTANCSVVPSTTPSNAGIAGAGVLLSFIITAGIALSISTALVVQDTWGWAAQQRKLHGGAGVADAKGRRMAAAAAAAAAASSGTPLPTTIGRKLLNSYSDQQIMTGIGIQSLGLAQVATLVPYHFFLIWMLGLLSTAAHNAALLALVHDFRRDWVLRWLRQALMLANLVLSCVYGVFVLRGLAVGLPPTLPMACVWEGSSGSSSSSSSGSAGGFQFVATVAVIAGNCAVFALATWYLHNRAQRFYRLVQTAGLALMGAVAVGVTIRVVLLSQAFGRPSVALADAGETAWSFGQLLSLLLLLLPLVSAVEIARGDVKVAPPVRDDGGDGGGDDGLPLVENPTGGDPSFQPAPYFGRRGRR